MKYYKSPDTHYHENDGYYEENYPEYDDYQHERKILTRRRRALRCQHAKPDKEHMMFGLHGVS